MDQKYFIGDKVKTSFGTGFIEEVYTWRDCVIEMSDPEAVEFNELCRNLHGDSFRDDWYRLVVNIGGKSQFVESYYVISFVEKRPRK